MQPCGILQQQTKIVSQHCYVSSLPFVHALVTLAMATSCLQTRAPHCKLTCGPTSCEGCSKKHTRCLSLNPFQKMVTQSTFQALQAQSKGSCQLMSAVYYVYTCCHAENMNPDQNNILRPNLLAGAGEGWGSVARHRAWIDHCPSWHLHCLEIYFSLEWQHGTEPHALTHAKRWVAAAREALKLIANCSFLSVMTKLQNPTSMRWRGLCATAEHGSRRLHIATAAHLATPRSASNPGMPL